MTDRSEAHGRIVSRAPQDPSFREQLLTDPVAALAAELGRPVPRGVTVRVVEEGPDEVFLVLPAAPPEAGALSDAELSSAAGGQGAEAMCAWGTTLEPGSLIGNC